jgi:hypothetical protein
MSEFAKLFGSGDDQMVVMIQSNEKGDPEVRVYFQPKDIGVCSFALVFSDTDNGWIAAEKAFESVDEKKARRFVGQFIGRPEVVIKRKSK